MTCRKRLQKKKKGQEKLQKFRQYIVTVVNGHFGIPPK